jgi:hypothetical protein
MAANMHMQTKSQAVSTVARKYTGDKQRRREVMLCNDSSVIS